ncbi:MAG TPA: 3-oxoacyl-[acyl-carrier-protein] synthase III C-terminal domain-containing protein [Phycisphaerae bacterium]|nr:3-oxoacyl-[acyl-carrier-protein] synthase III C-terminal domain-containing protein [Phycisphaerae bacterium]
MATYIHALATAVPEAALTTQNAAKLLADICPDARTARLMAKLLPHTGIERRHLAALETQASLDEPDGLYRRAVDQLRGPGMHARSQAFDEASNRLVARLLRPMASEELSAVASLITVCCTHASSPGLEQAVFKGTTVPHGVERWNLGFMGCSAALAAMRLAHRNIAVPALAVACELSSLHFQYSADLEQLTANLLFADGAAAVLMHERPSPIRIVQARCLAIPAFAEQMVWRAGDFGLRLSLSPELSATLAAHLPDTVRSFLAEARLTAAQIDHWLVHPGGPQILDAVNSALELPGGALTLSRRVLRHYGNMSSPTILFILRAALEAGMVGRFQLLAFGPGLTIEMMLVEIDGPATEILRGPFIMESLR